MLQSQNRVDKSRRSHYIVSNLETVVVKMALENENMQGLVLFSHIHRAGSLTAAAQLLGISRSSVSKQLAALERRIGSRLLNRTTRKIVLTDVGHQVLEEARKVELALQTIEHISEDSQSEISGSLKVSCASAQGRVHLVPLLAKFLKRYPKVNVNLQLDDNIVDMVANNIDVSIRVGHLPDSTLIARKLGDLTGVICASPDYLESAPPLKKPSDLSMHRCLFYRNSNFSMDKWVFDDGENMESVTVSGPLTINDPEALLAAAIDHTGVLITDKGLLGDSISNQKLVTVLDEYRLVGGLPMYVVYPEREFIPAKNRALINYLLDAMPQTLQGDLNLTQ